MIEDFEITSYHLVPGVGGRGCTNLESSPAREFPDGHHRLVVMTNPDESMHIIMFHPSQLKSGLFEMKECGESWRVWLYSLVREWGIGLILTALNSAKSSLVNLGSILYL